MPQRLKQPGGSSGARSPSSPPPATPVLGSIEDGQQELEDPSLSRNRPLPQPASPLRRTNSFNRTSLPPVNAAAVIAVTRLSMTTTAGPGDRTQEEGQTAATPESIQPPAGARTIPVAEAATSPGGSTTDSRTSRSLFSRTKPTAEDRHEKPFAEHVGAADHAPAEDCYQFLTVYASTVRRGAAEQEASVSVDMSGFDFDDDRQRVKVARELADAKLRAVGFEYHPRTRRDFTDADPDAAGTADKAHRVAAEAVRRADEAQQIADEKLAAAGLGFLCKRQQDSVDSVPEPDLDGTAASDDDNNVRREDLRAKMEEIFADKGLETQVPEVEQE
jgi:hypothetical protein